MTNGAATVQAYSSEVIQALTILTQTLAQPESTSRMSPASPASPSPRAPQPVSSIPRYADANAKTPWKNEYE